MIPESKNEQGSEFVPHLYFSKEGETVLVNDGLWPEVLLKGYA